VEGNIIGELNIDGNVTANNVVSLNDVCIDGNLVVSEITPKEGGNIRMQGNIIVDSIIGPGGKVEISCIQYSQGDVTTTDGTQTTVVTIDMVNDNVCFIESRTVGEEVGGSNDAIAFNTRWAFQNVGGVVSSLSTRNQDKWSSGGGTNAWKEDFNISGTTVTIDVTGQSGKTISWRTCTERICV
jgi:hypothetical protein